MLDAATYPTLRARPAPGLPIADMIVGLDVDAAADLLPRLFNLCRVAQRLAARAAFGLPLAQGWQLELRKEILREHIVKLCLKWPAVLNQPALPLPRNWIDGQEETRDALFGSRQHLPETYDAFDAFLAEGAGFAKLLRSIQQLFAPREAVRSTLPLSTTDSLFQDHAQENSVATRHATHPVMQAIEKNYGRGPLWSATAITYDIASLWDGELPTCDLRSGRAVVPAARGLYGVEATVEAGHVTAFRRITPTDHLLMPGAAMEQCLASLPRQNARALATLVLSILDPCHPVSLEPVTEEEKTDA